MFHAQTFEGIRQENCPVTGFLFDSDYETLRYRLFRVLTYQIRRMQAATAPEVTLDNSSQGGRLFTTTQCSRCRMQRRCGPA